MFILKTPISGRLDNRSGGWIRTNGLRVMSFSFVSHTLDRQATHFSLT